MLDHKPKAKPKPAQQAAIAPNKTSKKAGHAQSAPAAPGKTGSAPQPVSATKTNGYAAQRGAVQPKSAVPAHPIAAPAAKAGHDAPKQGKAALKLPDSTLELLESTTLQVTKVASYQGAKSMPGNVASQLLEGVQREAVSDAKTLNAVLSDYIDGGEVDVYTIAGQGQSLRWLRFWCGDTEVGYIFDAGKLVAIVGDQQINPV